MTLRYLIRSRSRPNTASPQGSLTSAWFSRDELDAARSRYSGYRLTDLSYATVRDYVDSFEHLRPLASAQGDLKDVQRPWTFKALLATVPNQGRVLEIGAGQPYVADLLARLDYDAWVVDPYDGSGNGPVEYDYFKQACPEVRFFRERFSDALEAIPADSFDCVYSVSVLEHLDPDGMDAVVRGMRRCLTSTGVSIHAIDHVHRGRGDEEHLANLTHITHRLGLTAESLTQLLAELSQNTETYYLSAESHNRWRGSLPYDDFPMRVCVSIQTVSGASDLANGPLGSLSSGSKS